MTTPRQDTPLDYAARLDDDRVRELRRRLLAWYRRHKRELPWRESRDAYRVLVSEVMLQQTQVATARPYYERFVDRWPTPAALAEASDEEVLKAWQGLGYYRRALALRDAARKIAEDHAGRVPDDRAALGALPGVGPYTMGAVLSIAFGRPVPAVDGNAIRVLARWLAVAERVDRGPVRRELERAAARVMSRRAPGNWNQAVMELGARVCTPRSPECEACPVEAQCEARAEGLEDELPNRRGRRPVPHIEVGAGIIWRGSKILLCRRPIEKMLGGLWEFPGGKREAGETIRECISREIAEECDLDVTVGDHLVDVTHAYSHLKVTLRCYHGRAPRGRAKTIGCAEARWVRPERIAEFALPAADVKILEALGVDPETARRAARGTA